VLFNPHVEIASELSPPDAGDKTANVYVAAFAQVDPLNDSTESSFPPVLPPPRVIASAESPDVLWLHLITDISPTQDHVVPLYVIAFFRPTEPV
jgi:hypothetical protein